jgi:hypothetical protein
MKHILSEDFFDAIMNKANVFTEAKKGEQLDNIKAYIDKYRGKRGRPNKILQIIDAIDAFENKEIASSDVVKYAAIALANEKGNIPWTQEDIIGFILSNIELTKKYADAIGEGGEVKAKELGKELAAEVLKEQEVAAEVIKEFTDALKKGTHKMVHQIPQEKLNVIQSTIIRSFQLYTSLLTLFYKVTKEEMFNHFLRDLKDIVIQTEDDLTYSFINQIISGLSKVGISVKKVLLEDKPKGYETKVSEIDTLQKTLKSVSGANYMLWPESESEIKSLADLSKYFTEINQYRKDAEEIVNKYQGRKKDLAPKEKKPVTEIWNEAKIKTLINQYIEVYDLNPLRGALAPHIKKIIDMAEQIIKENPSLAEYYKVTSDEDGVYDLITKLAAKITRYVPFEIRFGLED